MKTTALPLRDSINRVPCPLALLIPFALICFALSPQARATCQEGCDLINGNTFLGEDALLNNSGVSNTALGWSALKSNLNASWNTAIGSAALESNTFGYDNTATGVSALERNTEGHGNTATGRDALFGNTVGSDNTATGGSALTFNRSGSGNVADGSGALNGNTHGAKNTAVGFNALKENTTGNRNVALGFNAGVDLTTGDRNIDIGDPGRAGESNTIRIGQTADQTATFIAGISGATVPTGVAVIVDANGRLGTTTSSARYKEAINPMDKVSEAILSFKPVTFRYKREIDSKGTPQFGLIAEEVAKVNPDLVVRDRKGEIYTVRYEAVNAMLLNEFLKEHRKNEEQQATIAQLKSGMEALTAIVKEQAAQIQKVSAQLEASRSAPQVADSNY